MKYIRSVTNHKDRCSLKNLEISKKLLKGLFFFNLKCMQILFLLKQKQNIAPFQTRLKNFCIITGRSRSVYSRFKVSRIILRKLSSVGLFFGLKKNS